MSGSSKKVSVRVKRSLLDHMKEVWKKKYGGKGRSRWVDESIKEYLTNENYFYKKANFLDSTDSYAYQFILEVKTEGALTRRNEDVGIKVSEIVKSNKEFEDPISNEKFIISVETSKLLDEAVKNIGLMRSIVKITDPRGCIIRSAIEYSIVHSSTFQRAINF